MTEKEGYKAVALDSCLTAREASNGRVLLILTGGRFVQQISLSRENIERLAKEFTGDQQ